MAFNRRGIELPVSMIIILLVSIMVLGLGGGFTYKLICSAEDKLLTLNAQQEQEIERRLATGPAVIIPDATKSADQPSTICGGGSVPGATYLLGIRNDNSVPTDFTIECVYKGIEARDLSGGGSCAKLQFREATTIASGEREALLIIANVDSQMRTGRHVYTMTVNGLDTGARSVNFYLDVK